jgi:hypothetical protein
LAALIGLSRLAASSVPVQLLSQVPLLDRLLALSVTSRRSSWSPRCSRRCTSPFPTLACASAPALVGGVCAGILWAAIGRFFTAFVLYSTRLTVVYAGLAIIVAALVWTYFNWIILLLGARVSFYAQNPNYLRLGLNELRLSCVDTERLCLSIMYVIADRYRSGTARLSISGSPRFSAIRKSPSRACVDTLEVLRSAHERRG